MPTNARRDPAPELVRAACDGDQRALDALIFASLPLIYNLVGWVVGDPVDVEDAVRDTMLRVVHGIGELRQPAEYRFWLIAIALRHARGPERGYAAGPDQSWDFASRTIEVLGLTEQRRDMAEATRWLDAQERELLALWWLEESGHLDRPELASGLGLSGSHAAVRVHRLKQQLDVARSLIPALRDAHNCAMLRDVADGWDGAPNPLWRKRFARHVRDCSVCSRHDYALLPLSGLLRGLALAPVPESLRMSAAVLAAGARSGASSAETVLLPVISPGSHTAFSATAPRAARAAQGGQVGQAGPDGEHGGRDKKRRSRAVSPFFMGGAAVVAAAVAAYVLIPGSRPATTPLADVTQPARVIAPKTPGRNTPAAATHSAKPSTSPDPKASKSPTQTPTTHAASTTSTTSAANVAAPAIVTAQSSSRKGVSAWTFTGDDQALAESGASWFYTWSSSTEGLSAPGVGFVPMIWGSGSVTPTALTQAKQDTSCNCLLGFNEPDNGGQSNMTPAQALALWPQLEATGLELGSPAVASGGADTGGWLDQFMTGAQKAGYRVNFITLHWYGSDFNTTDAVTQLQTYIQAVHNKYHLPIWLTEFALISFANGGSTYPSESVQASFLTQATAMLDNLPYVQRYAWFALPATSGLPSTGLFQPGPVITPVGTAFEEAR